MDNLYIPDELSGRKISEAEKQQVWEKGKTDEKLKGFFSAEKEKHFEAYLVNKKGKLQFDGIDFNDGKKLVKEATKEPSIPNELFGTQMKPEHVEALKRGEKTELIKGLVVDDKQLDGHLYVNDKNKIVVLPPEITEDKYNVPKKVFGVKLTDHQRDTLSTLNKETELIKGFKKIGPDNKPMNFDAHLSVIKDEKEKYRLNFKYLEKELKITEDKTQKKSKGGGLSRSIE